MLRKTNFTFLIFHGLMLILIGLSLLFAVDKSFFRQLLSAVTSENGIIAIAVFFIFLMTSSFAMIIIFNHQFEKVFTSARRHFVSLIAISFYIFAMQEIKWGQFLQRQKFSTDNTDAFEVATGSNTLINQDTVFFMLHMAIFLGFIVLPMIIYFLPERYKRATAYRGKIVIYLPSFHNILMFAFSCLLFSLMNPAYNLNFYLLGLFTCALTVLFITNKKYITLSNVVHLLVFTMALLLLSYFAPQIPIENTYHQLWKFFAAYAFFYWLYNWTINLKNRAKVSA